AGLASGIAAWLTKRGIVFVKHLNAVVPTVADINLAVIGDLDAVYGVAEECGFPVALGVVRDPRPGGPRSLVVDGIVAIGAKVADMFPRVGVNDQNATVSIAVGDVQAVRRGVYHHVRRLIEDWGPINAATGVVAIRSSRSSADPHLEIAIHIELQYEAVAA